MESLDDIVCRKFLENPTINPKSGRTINKDKDVYNNLVKLCKKRNFDVSVLDQTPQIPIINNKNLIPISISNKKLLPLKSSQNKIWIPVKKQVNVIDNKSPDDLLQLYLTDSLKTLDNKTIIDDLNKKYKTKIDTESFIEWFKYYNYVNVPKNVKYLYMLENEQFIDPSYLNKFGNGEVTEKMIYILFDWLKNITLMRSVNFTYIGYSYACTLFYVIFSRLQSKIKKENFQIYGLVSLYYASIITTDCPLDLDYISFLSNKAYTEKQLQDADIEVFNILSGQLIYPSPIFFIDKNNKDLISLVEFAVSIPEISIYKPSLIAHTCTYILTGKHTIYSIDEMTNICSIIQKLLNRLTKTSLTTYKNRAINLVGKINVVCKENLEITFLQPLYKYNEPWHLGEFEEFETVGEGGYGTVTKIKRKLCGMEYVSKISSGESDKSFLNEISILKLLSNQSNIISICGFYRDDDQFKIILPLMKGSVWDLVRSDQLDKSKYNKYFYQILLGIEQCHNHDLIHRDLKPQNIVYDEKNDNVLIIDFGVSECYQSFKNINDTNMANTINYRSPECLIFEDENYGQEIDVWSMGCVFYFMITGLNFVDYPNISNIGYRDVNKQFAIGIFNRLGTPNDKEWPGITNKLKELDISPSERDPNLSKDLYPFDKLILSCLTPNPKNRPIIEELLIDYKL